MVINDQTIKKMKRTKKAFFWESPDKIKSSNRLHRRWPNGANYTRFTKPNRMSACKKGVMAINFKSPSGTNLVIPCPTNPKTNYVHMQRFMKTADKKQINSLFKLVAKVKKRTKKEIVRTHGLNVPWLHVRVEKKN
tara:strand:- start:1920 stop:2327 length:408 start_codon:yes stop_codon:yes gene_type:complete